MELLKALALTLFLIGLVVAGYEIGYADGRHAGFTRGVEFQEEVIVQHCTSRMTSILLDIQAEQQCRRDQTVVVELSPSGDTWDAWCRQ